MKLVPVFVLVGRPLVDRATGDQLLRRRPPHRRAFPLFGSAAYEAENFALRALSGPPLQHTRLVLTDCDTTVHVRT